MILSGFNMEYMIYIWLAVAIFALIIELMTNDLTSIWASAAGIITMVVSIFCHILWVQLVIFGVLTVVLACAVRPIVKKYFRQNIIKTNSETVIGRVGTVTEDIYPDNRGAAKVDGKEWTAVAEEELKIGDKVIVLAIDGVKLIVKKAEEN